jgi:hypothetical protein
MNSKSTLQAFTNSPYFSIKHTNYFDIYDKLLSKYVGKDITFVEIGILDGGSLFMWREFFGKDARIIGVELNPEAIKWREHGFEIFIGDQSDPQFWVDFFLEVGDIHVLLDDGGHRNDQQIVTVKSALPHVLNGGLIVVEDTQTSFMKFESFRRYSFVSFLEDKIKSLYARSDELVMKGDAFSDSVHSMEFFTGVCVLHIDRELCVSTQRIENDGNRSYQSDFRYNTDSKLQDGLRNAYNWISWDYLTKERVEKYPRVGKLAQVTIIRNLIRLWIIPIRFLLYFSIQFFNMMNLKKIIKS